jgi:replicative DNA helicase
VNAAQDAFFKATGNVRIDEPALPLGGIMEGALDDIEAIGSRYEEISEIARCLKLMAKELDVPVVAVSQLNRGPEQRTDRRPMLSDLRDSGALEDNADLVILLHREDAYEKAGPRAGEADLLIAKHRQGPTAMITVAFQGHYSRSTWRAEGGRICSVSNSLAE